jgi:hypothetical protein
MNNLGKGHEIICGFPWQSMPMFSNSGISCAVMMIGNSGKFSLHTSVGACGSLGNERR